MNTYENPLIKEEIEEFDESGLELLNYLSADEREEFDIPDYYTNYTIGNDLKDTKSNTYKAIQHIKKNGIKQSTKIELKKHSTLMSKYSEFLNQSKVLKKSDVINSLHMIETKGGAVDSFKLSYLLQFTKLIFSNGLTFKDLHIENDYYDYGPFKAESIWFDIENITETIDYGDYKVFEADVVFTLKDKSKKSLKYEFRDDTIEKFDKKYKAFIFKDYERDAEPYYYFDSYQPKAKYRIVLNDLFQYLDFIGKHFYNKKFIEWDDCKNLLTNDYGEYFDKSWQIDKKNFKYVDKIEKKEDIDIIDSMTDNELFVYALDLYYKEYINFELFELKEKIFKVVKYLDRLIGNNYPMAYLVKGLLHLDGKIVLRDLSMANFYLHKAYDLGLQTPTLLIWNENDLYQNSKYSSFSMQKINKFTNKSIDAKIKMHNIQSDKKEKNEEISKTTNDTKMSFKDKFNNWYSETKDKEVFRHKILSAFVKTMAKPYMMVLVME